MKNYWFRSGGLILLGIMMIALFLTLRPIQNISSELFASATPTCVPIRTSSSANVAQLTSTPNPLQYGTVPPSRPSVTPIPYSKITDLSPDSPDDHKGQFIVFHCDGTYELFLSAGTAIPLQQGDHLLNSFPPAFLMEGQLTALAYIPTPRILNLTPSGFYIGGYLLSSSIQDPVMVETVRHGLAEKIGATSYGGKVFCSFALLMPLLEGRGNTLQAYTFSLCDEFYAKDAVLRPGTTVEGPVSISLQRQNKTWIVTSFQSPKFDDESGIRKIFPPETWHLIFRSTDEDGISTDSIVIILHQNNTDQAISLLGLPYYLTPAPTLAQ